MEQSINTFGKGLQLDTNPTLQGNESLTDMLNGTLITLDGNDLILQNDTGNIEVADLNTQNESNVKYIPVGMKEFGGILYIASIKQTLDKTTGEVTNQTYELGTYPSPNYDVKENINGYISDINIDELIINNMLYDNPKSNDRIFTIHDDKYYLVNYYNFLYPLKYYLEEDKDNTNKKLSNEELYSGELYKIEKLDQNELNGLSVRFGIIQNNGELYKIEEITNIQENSSKYKNNIEGKTGLRIAFEEENDSIEYPGIVFYKDNNDFVFKVYNDLRYNFIFYIYGEKEIFGILSNKEKEKKIAQNKIGENENITLNIFKVLEHEIVIENNSIPIYSNVFNTTVTKEELLDSKSIKISSWNYEYNENDRNFHLHLTIQNFSENKNITIEPTFRKIVFEKLDQSYNENKSKETVIPLEKIELTEKSIFFETDIILSELEYNNIYIGTIKLNNDVSKDIWIITVSDLIDVNLNPNFDNIEDVDISSCINFTLDDLKNEIYSGLNYKTFGSYGIIELKDENYKYWENCEFVINSKFVDKSIINSSNLLENLITVSSSNNSNQECPKYSKIFTLQSSNTFKKLNEKDIPYISFSGNGLYTFKNYHEYSYTKGVGKLYLFNTFNNIIKDSNYKISNGGYTYDYTYDYDRSSYSASFVETDNSVIKHDSDTYSEIENTHSLFVEESGLSQHYIDTGQYVSPICGGDYINYIKHLKMEYSWKNPLTTDPTKWNDVGEGDKNAEIYYIKSTNKYNGRNGYATPLIIGTDDEKIPYFGTQDKVWYNYKTSNEYFHIPTTISPNEIEINLMGTINITNSIPRLNVRKTFISEDFESIYSINDTKNKLLNLLSNDGDVYIDKSKNENQYIPSESVNIDNVYLRDSNNLDSVIQNLDLIDRSDGTRELTYNYTTTHNNKSSDRIISVINIDDNNTIFKHQGEDFLKIYT